MGRTSPGANRAREGTGRDHNVEISSLATVVVLGTGTASARSGQFSYSVSAPSIGGNSSGTGQSGNGSGAASYGSAGSGPEASSGCWPLISSMLPRLAPPISPSRPGTGGSGLVSLEAAGLFLEGSGNCSIALRCMGCDGGNGCGAIICCGTGPRVTICLGDMV